MSRLVPSYRLFVWVLVFMELPKYTHTHPYPHSLPSPFLFARYADKGRQKRRVESSGIVKAVRLRVSTPHHRRFYSPPYLPTYLTAYPYVSRCVKYYVWRMAYVVTGDEVADLVASSGGLGLSCAMLAIGKEGGRRAPPKKKGGGGGGVFVGTSPWPTYDRCHTYNWPRSPRDQYRFSFKPSSPTHCF